MHAGLCDVGLFNVTGVEPAALQVWFGLLAVCVTQLQVLNRYACSMPRMVVGYYTVVYGVCMGSAVPS